MWLFIFAAITITPHFMKRFITIATAVLFFSNALMAQEHQSSSTPSDNLSFAKGDNVISLGVGIGGYYTYYGTGYTGTPNFILSYENGTFGNVGPGTISLGVLLSYKGIGYDYTNPYSNYYYNEKWTYYIIGLRSAYHWDFFNSPKCDPYAGIMLGYYFLGYTFSSNDPYYKNPGDPYYYLSSGSYGSYLAISLYLGFRYYLTPKVGLWAELGYGYSTLALGVNFKF